MKLINCLNFRNQNIDLNVEEIKRQINSKMDGLEKDQLKMVEEFVEKINSLNVNKWDLSQYVDGIVNQRAEVLHKLAQ